jgi:hypothetical protein
MKWGWPKPDEVRSRRDCALFGVRCPSRVDDDPALGWQGSASMEMTVTTTENRTPRRQRDPRNKGRLIGQKRPLKPKVETHHHWPSRFHDLPQRAFGKLSEDLNAVFAVKDLDGLAGRPSERPADDLRVQRAQV